jgi:hypothetical protein
MTFNELQDNLIGNWTGENTLRLSWMTPPEYPSASKLTAKKAIGDKFLTLEYTWEYENTAHEGFILLGFDGKQEIVRASWADSWHSSDRPMPLAGKINEKNVLELFGTYEVPNHPDWSWQINITPTADTVQVTMYNVTPEGEKDLAVRSDYKRLVH